MNGGWKTEPRWKGCAADGGRARREWKRGEGRVCVRARVGGEREKAREKERESGEHAAKRVIESRARSLLYRPLTPTPFPSPNIQPLILPFSPHRPSPPLATNHQTPLLELLFPIHLRFFSIRLHFPTIGFETIRVDDVDHREKERRREGRG